LLVLRLLLLHRRPLFQRPYIQLSPINAFDRHL
jgi:hypothetical protein